MKLIEMQDPFTGVPLDVAVMEDGTLLFDAPYDNKPRMITYNDDAGCYFVPREYMAHRDTCTVTEAAEYLDLSKMRISQLCTGGTLRSVRVGNCLIIDMQSVVDYGNRRKKE